MYHVTIEYSHGDHETNRKTCVAEVRYPVSHPKAVNEFYAVVKFDNAKQSLFTQNQINFCENYAGFATTVLTSDEKRNLESGLQNFWQMSSGSYVLRNGVLEEYTPVFTLSHP